MKQITWTLAFVMSPILGLTGAHAQIGQPSCAAVLDRIGGLIGEADLFAGKTPRQGANRCSISDLEYEVDRNLTVRVQRLVWSGDGFKEFVADGTPPSALTVQLEGLRFAPNIGDPVMQYLMDAQAASGDAIDVTVSAQWLADDNRLLIQSAEADFPGENAIWFDAEIDGVDLSSVATAQTSMGSFSITKTQTKVQSNGLFEQYVLMALGAALLDGSETPAVRAEELKREAIAEIDALPDAIFPVPSRVALKALVSDMPNPKGTLSVDMSATPGLGPGRFLPLALSGGPEDLSAIWPLLRGVRYDVQYDRQ